MFDRNWPYVRRNWLLQGSLQGPVCVAHRVSLNGASSLNLLGQSRAVAGGTISVAQKVYLAFANAGGGPTKATVTADEVNGTVTVSDGKTTTICTTDGVCRVADGS